MIHDIVIWISEALFWLTGGVPIVYTFWFIPWVMLGSAIMMSPFFVMIYGKGNRTTTLTCLMLIVLFFPTLIVTMAPGMAQQQMMMRCETVTITVTTDRVETGTVNVRQCSTKDNFYDEFGEWVVK